MVQRRAGMFDKLWWTTTPEPTKLPICFVTWTGIPYSTDATVRNILMDIPIHHYERPESPTGIIDILSHQEQWSIGITSSQLPPYCGTSCGCPMTVRSGRLPAINITKCARRFIEELLLVSLLCLHILGWLFKEVLLFPIFNCNWFYTWNGVWFNLTLVGHTKYPVA